MTLKFIAALLRAPRLEQDRFYARQLPLGIFKTGEAYIRWVYEWRDRHSVYPSASAFRHRFPKCELVSVREPLQSILESVLDADLILQVESFVGKGKELHESGRSARDVASHFQAAAQHIRTYDLLLSDSKLDSRSALRTYRDFIKRKSAGLVKPPSPWATLNSLLGYSFPGELTIVAARPSLGKTWLMIAWAEYLRRQGERVLFISKEMPSALVEQRWLSLMYQLSYPKLKKGELSPQQLRRWAQKSLSKKESVPGALISGHETIKGVGFAHIIQKIQEFSPTALAVDGAYLIFPEEKFTNDVQRFGYISSMLKRISKAYALKSFAVIQAKRDAESDSISGATKASLVHLYGSDTWAQDADNVAIINGKRSAPVRTMSLEKAREGAVGEWTVNFRLHPFPDFSEVAGRHDSVVDGNIEFTGV